MKNPALITPSVMKWARKTAGMSVEDAATRFVVKSVAKNITPETVKSWESGKAAPTYLQLEKIAAIYHQPIIVFYLRKPPEEDTIKSEFQFLPKVQAKSLPYQIRFLVRAADNFRLNLYELHRGGQNPALKKIFADIRISASQDMKRAATKVRRYLNLSNSQQYKNDDDAFEARRNCLERHGISVFKESFEHDNFSGFCLHDPQFPIIYINNDMPSSRQSFTLFHELAHILMKKSGVDFRGDTTNTDEELACNQFAGEALAPEADIKKNLPLNNASNNNAIASLAKQYSVSQEVVLHQLRNINLIDRNFFDKKTAQLRKEQESQKQRHGPVNYAFKVYLYLSKSYTQAACAKYHHGLIDERQLADYLKTKVRYIDAIARFSLRDMKAD